MPSSSPGLPSQALLAHNLNDDILYGYGDPAVLRVPDRQGSGATWYLLVTSNDAPNAFPILRSRDLARWEPAGFVFPEGRAPGWTLQGEGVADFWAPELHRVGDGYLVVFSARARRDGELAIGVARSAHPEGPFVPDAEPLVAGGVIDPHVLVEPDGAAYLFWKQDANDRWPGLLTELLHRHPELIASLFPDAARQRTASACLARWPTVRTLQPMDRFLALQPLIEAVTADFSAFRKRLGNAVEARERDQAAAIVRDVLEAMRTPIYGQRLSSDARALEGPREVVILNDRPWEAHLVEGAWVTRQAGSYFLFYAGNDFTTADYGIGVAVARAPLGPYVKSDEPLLRSTPEWAGPGHPSVAVGRDGQPLLFLHAFHPDRLGYKVFRAMLSVPIAFEGDRVLLRS